MDQIHTKGGINLKGAAVGNGVGGGPTARGDRIRSKYVQCRSTATSIVLVSQFAILALPDGKFHGLLLARYALILPRYLCCTGSTTTKA